MILNRGQRTEDKRQAKKAGDFTVLCPLPSALSGRHGFTLLELLLATLIGGMILSGLYIVMNMTVSQTQSSREQADAEGVSRAVFNRITLDLTCVLGPAPPKSGGKPETAATGESTAPPVDTGTGTGTGTGTDPGTDTGTMPAEGEPPAEAPAALIALQVGITGDGTRLTIYGNRVPDALANPGALNRGTDDRQQTSGLVRIDYWLAASGGLCRRESPWVTAQGIGDGSEPDLSSESADVIADEVTGVAFAYIGGSGEVETWDDTSSSPPAPPLAVRVTLTFSRPNPRGGEPVVKTISQVIAIRTAPGSAVPELVDPVTPSATPPTGEETPTDTGTTGASGASGSGTSGGGTTGGGTGGTTGGGTSGGGGTTGGGTTGGTGGAGGGTGGTGGKR